MSRTSCNVITVALALVASAALFAADTAPAKRDTPANKQSYRERYAVLSEHNIFVRDRARPSTTARSGYSSSRETPKAPPPEASFVLTGIVLEEGQYRAYVEDIQHAKVLRLNVGDPVARGRIGAIEIDGVAYESAEQPAWVALGRDLRGEPFNLLAVATSQPTATTTATTGPSAAGAGAAPLDPNSPGLTMEEKMKLRRQQGK